MDEPLLERGMKLFDFYSLLDYNGIKIKKVDGNGNFSNGSATGEFLIR